MISAIFFMNQKGEVLISRIYRDDIRFVKEWSIVCDLLVAACMWGDVYDVGHGVLHNFMLLECYIMCLFIYSPLVINSLNVLDFFCVDEQLFYYTICA